MYIQIAPSLIFEASFFKQADATILDGNTGRAWMLEGNAPAVNTCAGGKRTWVSTFQYVAFLNSSNYLGLSDWRLPTVESSRL